MHETLYFTGEDSARRIHSWKEELLSMRRRWKTLDFQRSALIVIDMQRYFLDERSHAFVPTGAAIVPNVQRLLGLFRAEGRPVVFTRFAVQPWENDPVGDFWGDTVVEGSEGSEIAETLKPKGSEKVLRKTTYGSFHGTDLEKYLKHQGVRGVLITGVLTNLCCETAAREAVDLGFDVFFAMDATATFNEEMHRASLLNLACGFVTPVVTQDVLMHCAVR